MGLMPLVEVWTKFAYYIIPFIYINKEELIHW